MSTTTTTGPGAAGGGAIGRARTPRVHLFRADARGPLPLADGSVHCVCTSPPYHNLRDYQLDGQIGLERRMDCLGWATQNPCGECYVCSIVAVFRGVWRVLREDGVAFLNIGDSYVSSPPGNKDTRSSGLNGAQSSACYSGRLLSKDNRSVRSRPAGLKPKDLCLVPARVALALQADGWYLRSDIIWHKSSPMPESVRDRPTRSHETVFLLAKRPTYYYDQEAERQALADSTTNDRREFRSNRPGWSGHPGVMGEKGHPLPTSGAGANLRTVWTISTRGEGLAHFALMPPELARRCISLGTSERGCCPSCGSPYRRVVESERAATRPGAESKVLEQQRSINKIGRPSGHPNVSASTTLGSIVGNRDSRRHTTTTRTVAWEPGCDCDAGEPVPCTVFDPFGGAATTAIVARDLGRIGVACDLSDEYLQLARGRARERLLFRDHPSLAAPRARRPLENQASFPFDGDTA